MFINKIIWLFTAILLFSGCDSGRVYEDNIDFQNRIWSAPDIKTFDFHIAQPGLHYNAYINLRNTSEYPHYNIYIRYTLKDSLRNNLKSELININLFDPKTGFPNGKSSAGDIFEHQQIILDMFTFPDSGKYLLSFQQYMRYDSLPEIISVGLRVEKEAFGY